MQLETLRTRIEQALEQWLAGNPGRRRAHEKQELVDAAVATAAAFEIVEQCTQKMLGLSGQPLAQAELQAHADRADRLDDDGRASPLAAD